VMPEASGLARKAAAEPTSSWVTVRRSDRPEVPRYCLQRGDASCLEQG